MPVSVNRRTMMEKLKDVKPWGEQAVPLILAGWEPVPLPVGEKGPPPKGLTGAAGLAIDEVELLEYDSASNVAVRLPSGVLGLDFDLYRSKDALKALQRRLGELPDTFITTSQANALTEGFTAFYRIPEDFRANGDFGGLDIVQRRHRYSLVTPSLHPSGRRYRWATLSDPYTPTTAPEVDSLPELPTRWLEALRAPKEEALKSWGDVPTDVDAVDNVSHVVRGGVGCLIVQRSLGAHIRKLGATGRGSGASRHDLGVAASWNLAMLRRAGHSGYESARDVYVSSFLSSFVGGDSDREGSRHEAAQLFISAEQKAGQPLRSCACLSGGNKNNRRRAPRLTSKLFK